MPRYDAERLLHFLYLEQCPASCAPQPNRRLGTLTLLSRSERRQLSSSCGQGSRTMVDAHLGFCA